MPSALSLPYIDVVLAFPMTFLPYDLLVSQLFIVFRNKVNAHTWRRCSRHLMHGSKPPTFHTC